MTVLTDHASLIAALGGAAEVASLPAIDVQPVTVRAWAARNKIPPEYWPVLITLAGEQGVESVSAAWLMQTTPPRRRSSSVFDDHPATGRTDVAAPSCGKALDVSTRSAAA